MRLRGSPVVDRPLRSGSILGQGPQDRREADQRPQRIDPGQALVPRAAFKRRALVPAEGYYEWQKTEGGKKIPNYLYSEKDDVLAFAGLYEF